MTTRLILAAFLGITIGCIIAAVVKQDPVWLLPAALALVNGIITRWAMSE